MNSKWISIEENGLPKDGDDYIVAGKYRYQGEDWEYFVDVAGSHGDYIDNFWDTFNDWDEGQEEIHITHYMPMPEHPIFKENDIL